MRKVLLELPDELLIEVDEAAKRELMYRAEYIRYVLKKEVHGKYPQAIEAAVADDPARLLDLDDS